VTSLWEHLEGKYEVLGQLEEEDGAGEVYQVRHLFLDESRLVRVIRPPMALTREASASYLDEARGAMRLRHPGIAQLHDFSLDDEGNAWITRENIEGLPLDVALRELGPPPVGLALEIAQQALRALGYLHRGGMVHRDVAPERLVLARDVDGQPLVKWTDLGISRLLAAGQDEIPMAGLFPARPRHAAPEQFGSGGREPDARSDLYSFGLVLYELLTGRFPFSGHDPFSYMAGHLSAPPLDFAESDPQGRLPGEVREALLQTLAKDPAQRPASAEELARRLATVQPRFPDQGDYLDRALVQARKRATALLPVIPPPKPKLAPPPPEPAPIVAPVAPHPVAPVVPVVTAPAPVAVPDRSSAEDIPLRGAGVTPAREIEWDRPPVDFGTQRVVLDPPKKEPVPPPRPVAPPPVVAPVVPVAPAVPVATAAAVPSEASRSRGVQIAAVLLGVALLGGAIGWFLSRDGDAPAPAPSAVAETSPATEPAVPPAIEEVDPQPEPPPPPDNEKAAPAPAAVPPREEPRRRQEAVPPPPSQVPEGAVITAQSQRPQAQEPAAPEEGAPPAGAKLITPGPGVEYPEPVTEISAAYPQAAVASGRKTKVRVAVLVDENGNVIQTRIREGDPSGLGFNEAALEGARRMRYLPATKDGVPGKFWTEILLEFEPPPSGAPPG
jgi:TonB family protein